MAEARFCWQLLQDVEDCKLPADGKTQKLGGFQPEGFKWGWFPALTFHEIFNKPDLSIEACDFIMRAS